MKKLLLTLALAVGVLSMSANEAAITFSELELANGTEVTGVKVNDDISLIFNKGTNSNSPKYYTSGTAVRFYGSNTMKVVGAEGVTITGVEFTTGSGNQIVSGSTVTEGTLDTENQSWTGSANTFTLTEGGTSGHAKIEAISFTYTGGTGEGSIGVFTPEPEPVEYAEVANIKAFLDAENASELSQFTNPVTAVYQNGSYLYVKDETGSLLVYGSVGQTYANGEVIPAGFVGKYASYYGNPQLTSPDLFTAGTAGTVVEPTEIGLDELGVGYANEYIVITGVDIAATDKTNTFAISNDAGESQLYARFSDVEVPEGSNYNIEGFVAVYNETVQIYPTRVWSNSGLEAVATPVITPAAGNVEKGTEVIISTETEGATIYYTLDGTTPTTESTVYTAPIILTESVTVTAIAAKEGMDNSAVARASYTIVEPLVIEGDATFNFEMPNTLDPAQETPTADNASGASIGGIEFIDTDVTVVLAGGSTTCRLYYGYNTGVEARLYNGGTITITAPEGQFISGVNFYGNGILNLSYTEGETLTPLTETSWTSEAGVQTAVFTAVEGQATSNGRVDLKGIGVNLIEGTGIDAVVADRNAAVEYFNLQGVRVANPENGLYIRRQGNSVTKVLVK